MEVNPAGYFSISDEWTGNPDDLYQDPRIIKNSISRRNGKYTEEELIHKMWSQGTYNFRFEVLSSSSSMPTTTIVCLTPAQLWDFNFDYKYKPGSIWKHSKRTYKIDPDNFTSKRIDLRPYNLSLGKWDLSMEALERYVSIYEEDKGTEYEFSRTYEMSHLNSMKINGALKYGLGTKFDPINSSIDLSTSTTTKETKTITYRRSDKDDALGTIKVYFYDPLILEQTENGYLLHSYNVGIVNFSFMVK
ncbi:MAG: hypothetical protein NC343_05245 [Muribaculum sp.]|nr:hypothetical protein [Muribaculaceae bacterium]MCM1081136.1 hypothetical protein [Muribaculum sp.]